MQAKLMLSGESSVNYYATMSREPLDVFFCTAIQIRQLEKAGIQIDENSRFPNVELRKIQAESGYFDMRNEAGYNIASPVHTYLELANSDKRGQETAEQLRKQILADLKKDEPLSYAKFQLSYSPAAKQDA